MPTLIVEPANARAPPQAPSASRPSTRPQRDYLSYSSIALYRQCPLRYFFKYVAGLPEETVSASLVFGGAIHRAIEHHFHELLAGNSPPSLETLLDQYRQGWQEREGQLAPAERDDSPAVLAKLAERMLQAFQQHQLSRPAGRILAIEEQLRGEVIAGLPDILGRIDLIVETNESLVISDWKSSRARWSAGQVEDAAEQLLLYSELAKDFAPGKPLRIELAVVTKTKNVQIETHSLAMEPVQVARTKAVVEHVWRAIEQRVFYPAPSLLACPSCAFRAACRKWCG